MNQIKTNTTETTETVTMRQRYDRTSKMATQLMVQMEVTNKDGSLVNFIELKNAIQRYEDAVEDLRSHGG